MAYEIISQNNTVTTLADENGNVRVYASVFEPTSANTELKPIETDREWKIIETVLDSIQEESNKNN